jgi:radical SAM protein with 4Fe4S-binding SPASM domain
MLKHVTIDGIRLHLIMEANQLMINGYYSIYLNDTAKEILSIFIDTCKSSESSDKIIANTLDAVQKRYPKITRETADRDLKKLIEAINHFGQGQIPCHLVGLDQFDKHNAPQRMDLALTYYCPNKCPHCYLPKNESAHTLSTKEWKEVIDKLWEIGIPQIAFTGGECTIRADLPELVTYAKEFITGIITNGTKITPELAKQLKDGHLDWIQITLESANHAVHDEMQGRIGAYTETLAGIRNAVAAGLSVSINVTLTQKNVADLPELIRFVKTLGVQFVSTNALINSGRGIDVKPVDGIDEKDLQGYLNNAKEEAKLQNITFNWFLPTCYKNLDPVKEGFGERACSACNINMLIEPDGTVIPCQSWTDQKLGNILTDTWESIWNNPVSVKIRERGFAPDECGDCDYFAVCGGGCPLDQINGKKQCGGES